MPTITRKRVVSPAPLGLARKAAAAIEIAPAPYFRWKRAIDCLIAVVLLIPGLPLIGLLAMAVRLTSRGPAIYRQIRVGKGGRMFEIYKLRSMTHDAERESGAVWAKQDDWRVTSLGRFLRKCHLDELPQLFNVLKGEMSLVGPRPERPEFLHVLAAEIPGYLNRLAVLPGITGLAQLNLPPDSNLHGVRRKLAVDLEYVRQAGVFLDMRVLLCTLFRLPKIPEPFVLYLFGVYRKVADLDGDAAALNKSHRIFGASPSIAGNGNGNGNGNGGQAGVTPVALASSTLGVAPQGSKVRPKPR